ncbi:uncharacterized protein KRP23_12107 [Phytophthora ramorum]|uniref:uncharacterized protein n=1 Tax=Phytophthora ramorum TaxID=164328 RepID=UPI0030B74AD6|nr:hypothetical protein KRP23_12107 [Phytophthora ramorum]
MCAIAQDGLGPLWKDPLTWLGARPTPANYPEARTGASLVVDKLLADYYKGRAIIVIMQAFEQDPTFHSSAFALVPKKDKPQHLDGRIIHDLSAPDGLSVNAQTASEASPDATWDPLVSIPRRVCELRRRYPGYNIYAMIANIAEAFHHVPARYRLHFTTHTIRQKLKQTTKRRRVKEKRDQLKQASVSAGTLGNYSRNFKFWETFCNDFGFPVWINELPRAEQAGVVGLFAALWALVGRNKARKGNKYQTFDGKMAAVAIAHKAVRNAKLGYHDPEFELIAQGYQHTHGDVDWKQPVTTSMLLKIHELRAGHDVDCDLLWGSIVLAFFFLDRSSELWDPVISVKSTGAIRTHCIKAANVILRDKLGTQVGP